MKCPMMKTRWTIKTGKGPKEVAEFQDCIGGECAWFDKSSEACAIWLLQDRIHQIIREGI